MDTGEGVALGLEVEEMGEGLEGWRDWGVEVGVGVGEVEKVEERMDGRRK